MPVTAVLLAAGKGARMGGPVPKQYMDLCGKPLLAWAFRALAADPLITDIVLVIPDGDALYVRQNIIAPALANGVPNKVRALVPGGSERMYSVRNGILSINWPCDYVFIHDGARPFVDHEMLTKLYDAVAKYHAAVAACPSKDTVKIADRNGFVDSSPDRRLVWNVQTPQCFSFRLVRDSYEKILGGGKPDIPITDDATVVAAAYGVEAKLVDTGYRNIKVTTPEDVVTAQALLSRKA